MHVNHSSVIESHHPNDIDSSHWYTVKVGARTGVEDAGDHTGEDE